MSRVGTTKWRKKDNFDVVSPKGNYPVREGRTGWGHEGYTERTEDWLGSRRVHRDTPDDPEVKDLWTPILGEGSTFSTDTDDRMVWTNFV